MTDYVTQNMMQSVDGLVDRLPVDMRPALRREWKLLLAQYRPIRSVEELRLGTHTRFVADARMNELNRGGTLVSVELDPLDERDALLKLRIFTRSEDKIRTYRFSNGGFFQKLTEEQRHLINIVEDDF